ncbi:Fc.00g053290.m01.CDS01 [Cosmosporella sp. VM-42]
MALSPLQSRLAASLAASVIVLVLYLLLFSPNLALAAELPVKQAIRFDEPLQRRDDLDLSYSPNFNLFDRSILGRAPPGVTALTNNAPITINLPAGTTECFMIENSTIFGQDNKARNDMQHTKRASSSRTIYLSVNTCLQPQKVSSKSPNPPQLTVYFSDSSDITCPDASKDRKKIDSQVFDEGAVMYTINATGDVYIGVSAPNITTDLTGVYNFEIAMSFDEFYHNYDGQAPAELLWMDSDSTSVLLLTKNLTQDYSRANQVMIDGPPYELFVQNDDWHYIDGLRHSICGLEKNAQFLSDKNNVNSLIRTGLTTRGPGGLPKQQFYFLGLNSSSSYTGILVKMRNDTSDGKKRDGSVGGGGTIFNATEFQTLSGTNCKVVTDLDFCDEIQYAVPGNDNKFNNTELAKVYDDYAKDMYSNFEKVLQQIPCESPPESAYSLARGCKQCREAYKRWLCTVSIPRCEDLMSNGSYGMIRNIGQAFPNGTKASDEMKQEFGRKPAFNASRNVFIDTTIQPGPYREILPCEDLCYEVVQACPAAMGFGCPQPYMTSFNLSYGQRIPDSTAVTCNYPGEARTKVSSASSVLPGLSLGMVSLIMFLVL